MTFATQQLGIADVVLVKPSRIGDERGYFGETFRDDWFRRTVADVDFVQENQSLSVTPGTVRGLHFQLNPFAQGKLVRCVAGAILDVAVDLRRGSPSFGQWVAAELTAQNGHQLWIPIGFAHGFCTLLPNTIVQYKTTAYYNAPSDRGIAWDDPAIGVEWPDLADPSLLSAKDAKQPAFADVPEYFTLPREEVVPCA